MSRPKNFWSIFLIEFIHWVLRIGVIFVPIAWFMATTDEAFQVTSAGVEDLVLAGLIALGACCFLALLTAKFQRPR